MKPRKVLVDIVTQTRCGAQVTCDLACGHRAVIRRQRRVVRKTRCEACTEAKGEENDRRWMMPRPFCKCGCRSRVPTGNRWYVNHTHANAYNRPRLQALAGKGARAAWAPGGGNYERYKARVRDRLAALVPEQETFTRAEVLRLANRARVEGYEKGYQAARMRYVTRAQKRIPA